MARPPQGAFQIEGLRQLQRHVSRAKDRDLPKRMQQAHKEVGEFIISRLEPRPVPAAVGAGRGSSIRTSGARYSVQLRVGGAHRDSHKEPWGARRVADPRNAPPRPYIIGTAEQNQSDIERKYLEVVIDAMEPAFAEGRANG